MASDKEIKSIHRATQLLLFLASHNEGKTFTDIREVSRDT